MTVEKFSKKQIKVLNWWCPGSPSSAAEGIIAEGSIRSGKTTVMALSFILWAMTSFAGANFAICGHTIAALRRNILVWLIPLLRECGMRVRDVHAENVLTVWAMGRENRFYIFGGGDEGRQDAIQGMTLSGVFFDEAAIQAESFINQATGRCSVEGAKLWFNCNPEGPMHWFKTRWIDRARSKKLLRIHFTLEDNPGLSAGVKKKYAAMYSGVFYKRYILGQWAVASGAIYDMFDQDEHVRTRNEAWERLYAAVDYGTLNPCTFGLYGVKNGSRHLIREYYHDGRAARQKTDQEYVEDMKNFLADEKISCIIADPSAASLIAALTAAGYRVIRAKNAVLPGIRCMAGEIAAGRFTADPSCVHTIRERGMYVWDEAAAQYGEDRPVKQHDHTCDRDRYAIYTDIMINAARRTNYSGKGAVR